MYSLVGPVYTVFLIKLSSALPLNYAAEMAVSEPGSLPLLLALTLLAAMVTVIVGCTCCHRWRNKSSSPAIQGFNNATYDPSPGGELTLFPPLGAGDRPAGQGAGVARGRSPVQFEPLPDLSCVTRAGVVLHPRPAIYNLSVSRGFSAKDWFDDPHGNFPRQRLMYQQELGTGWFGQALLGEARGITAEPRTDVVVKVLKTGATIAEQMYFLYEMSALRDANHPHVLRLLGRCLEVDPYLLILERCGVGDCKEYLQSRTPLERQQLLDTMALNKMALGAAAGLSHLHDIHYTHSDLAARSCRVMRDCTLKIGDYGCNIDKYRDDYYIAGEVALPVRWCAPEILECTSATIETKQVTKSSNVWSLGVLLWELLTFAALPYAPLSDDDVIQHVVMERNVQLSRPKLGQGTPLTDRMYQVMQLCWLSHSQRPGVHRIHALLSQLSAPTRDDFQERWESLRPRSRPDGGSGSASPEPPEPEMEPCSQPASLDSELHDALRSLDRMLAAEETVSESNDVSGDVTEMGEDSGTEPDSGGLSERVREQSHSVQDFLTLTAPLDSLEMSSENNGSEVGVGDEQAPMLAVPSTLGKPDDGLALTPSAATVSTANAVVSTKDVTLSEEVSLGKSALAKAQVDSETGEDENACARNSVSVCDLEQRASLSACGSGDENSVAPLVMGSSVQSIAPDGIHGVECVAEHDTRKACTGDGLGRASVAHTVPEVCVVEATPPRPVDQSETVESPSLEGPTPNSSRVFVFVMKENGDSSSDILNKSRVCDSNANFTGNSEVYFTADDTPNCSVAIDNAVCDRIALTSTPRESRSPTFSEYINSTYQTAAAETPQTSTPSTPDDTLMGSRHSVPIYSALRQTEDFNIGLHDDEEPNCHEALLKETDREDIGVDDNDEENLNSTCNLNDNLHLSEVENSNVARTDNDDETPDSAADLEAKRLQLMSPGCAGDVPPGRPDWPSLSPTPGEAGSPPRSPSLSSTFGHSTCDELAELPDEDEVRSLGSRAEMVPSKLWGSVEGCVSPLLQSHPPERERRLSADVITVIEVPVDDPATAKPIIPPLGTSRGRHASAESQSSADAEESPVRSLIEQKVETTGSERNETEVDIHDEIRRTSGFSRDKVQKIASDTCTEGILHSTDLVPSSRCEPMEIDVSGLTVQAPDVEISKLDESLTPRAFTDEQDLDVTLADLNLDDDGKEGPEIKYASDEVIQRSDEQPEYPCVLWNPVDNSAAANVQNLLGMDSCPAESVDKCQAEKSPSEKLVRVEAAPSMEDWFQKQTSLSQDDSGVAWSRQCIESTAESCTQGLETRQASLGFGDSSNMTSFAYQDPVLTASPSALVKAVPDVSSKHSSALAGVTASSFADEGSHLSCDKDDNLASLEGSGGFELSGMDLSLALPSGSDRKRKYMQASDVSASGLEALEGPKSTLLDRGFSLSLEQAECIAEKPIKQAKTQRSDMEKAAESLSETKEGANSKSKNDDQFITDNAIGMKSVSLSSTEGQPMDATPSRTNNYRAMFLEGDEFVDECDIVNSNGVRERLDSGGFDSLSGLGFSDQSTLSDELERSSALESVRLELTRTLPDLSDAEEGELDADIVEPPASFLPPPVPTLATIREEEGENESEAEQQPEQDRVPDSWREEDAFMEVEIRPVSAPTTVSSEPVDPAAATHAHTEHSPHSAGPTTPLTAAGSSGQPACQGAPVPTADHVVTTEAEHGRVLGFETDSHVKRASPCVEKGQIEVECDERAASLAKESLDILSQDKDTVLCVETDADVQRKCSLVDGGNVAPSPVPTDPLREVLVEGHEATFLGDGVDDDKSRTNTGEHADMTAPVNQGDVKRVQDITMPSSGTDFPQRVDHLTLLSADLNISHNLRDNTAVSLNVPSSPSGDTSSLTREMHDSASSETRGVSEESGVVESLVKTVTDSLVRRPSEGFDDQEMAADFSDNPGCDLPTNESNNQDHPFEDEVVHVDVSRVGATGDDIPGEDFFSAAKDMSAENQGGFGAGRADVTPLQHREGSKVAAAVKQASEHSAACDAGLDNVFKTFRLRSSDPVSSDLTGPISAESNHRLVLEDLDSPVLDSKAANTKSVSLDITEKQKLGTPQRVKFDSTSSSMLRNSVLRQSRDSALPPSPTHQSAFHGCVTHDSESDSDSDVLVVDTESLEAKLLEGGKPRSHVAFVNSHIQGGGEVDGGRLPPAQFDLSGSREVRDDQISVQGAGLASTAADSDYEGDYESLPAELPSRASAPPAGGAGPAAGLTRSLASYNLADGALTGWTEPPASWDYPAAAAATDAVLERAVVATHVSGQPQSLPVRPECYDILSQPLVTRLARRLSDPVATSAATLTEEERQIDAAIPTYDNVRPFGDVDTSSSSSEEDEREMKREKGNGTDRKLHGAFVENNDSRTFWVNGGDLAIALPKEKVSLKQLDEHSRCDNDVPALSSSLFPKAVDSVNVEPVGLKLSDERSRRSPETTSTKDLSPSERIPVMHYATEARIEDPMSDAVVALPAPDSGGGDSYGASDAVDRPPRQHTDLETGDEAEAAYPGVERGASPDECLEPGTLASASYSDGEHLFRSETAANPAISSSGGVPCDTSALAGAGAATDRSLWPAAGGRRSAADDGNPALLDSDDSDDELAAISAAARQRRVQQLNAALAQGLDRDERLRRANREWGVPHAEPADAERYTPDWEDDDDGSTTSGEFVWQDGAQLADGAAATGRDDGSSSSSSSGSSSPTSPSSVGSQSGEEEFTPSVWSRHRRPQHGVLRSPLHKSELRKSVSFKRQKHHRIYEYPLASPSPDSGTQLSPEMALASGGSASQRPWSFVAPASVSHYTDWELDANEEEIEDVSITELAESPEHRAPRLTAASHYFLSTPADLSDEFFIRDDCEHAAAGYQASSFSPEAVFPGARDLWGGKNVCESGKESAPAAGSLEDGSNVNVEKDDFYAPESRSSAQQDKNEAVSDHLAQGCADHTLSLHGDDDVLNSNVSSEERDRNIWRLGLPAETRGSNMTEADEARHASVVGKTLESKAHPSPVRTKEEVNPSLDGVVVAKTDQKGKIVDVLETARSVHDVGTEELNQPAIDNRAVARLADDGGAQDQTGSGSIDEAGITTERLTPPIVHVHEQARAAHDVGTQESDTGVGSDAGTTGAMVDTGGECTDAERTQSDYENHQISDKPSSDALQQCETELPELVASATEASHHWTSVPDCAGGPEPRIPTTSGDRTASASRGDSGVGARPDRQSLFLDLTAGGRPGRDVPTTDSGYTGSTSCGDERSVAAFVALDGSGEAPLSEPTVQTAGVGHARGNV